MRKFKMKKVFEKQLTSGAIAMTFALALPISNANAFGLPDIKVPGVSTGSAASNVNWGDLASTGDSAEKKVYTGTRLLALSSITMAEALGYKEDAAALKAQVEAITKDGSVSGSFNLGETAEASGSIMEKISGDKEQLASLSEEQKAKLTESMFQYVIGGVKYLEGVKGVSDVASKAADAPMTQMANFVGVIKLAPVAATGAKDFFMKVPAVVNMMMAADIAMPDNISDMPGASDF
ncbi:conserved hypothetical protein [Bathymodiolus platifrons methanotrophic gill symbiont]|nr:conserved hypothetical protein [Bathymodiolus platifrons methanotrophic gill symbiont]GFO77283.1 hypothetical protein BPLS_P5638 [Bathymodiolus platifrons methanotrophic gill symbiont]